MEKENNYTYGDDYYRYYKYHNDYLNKKKSFETGENSMLLEEDDNHDTYNTYDDFEKKESNIYDNFREEEKKQYAQNNAIEAPFYPEQIENTIIDFEKINKNSRMINHFLELCKNICKMMDNYKTSKNDKIYDTDGIKYILDHGEIL